MSVDIDQSPTRGAYPIDIDHCSACRESLLRFALMTPAIFSLYVALTRARDRLVLEWPEFALNRNVLRSLVKPKRASFGLPLIRRSPCRSAKAATLRRARVNCIEHRSR